MRQRPRATAIRVHLVDLPPMLDGAIRTALADRSFDVVAGSPELAPSPQPTVVVMQASTLPRAWEGQLLVRPDASIILIEPRACDAELIELRLLRRRLGTVDAAAIASAVRAAAQREDRVAPTDVVPGR